VLEGYVLHLEAQKMQIYDLIRAKISFPDVNALQNSAFSGFLFSGTVCKIGWIEVIHLLLFSSLVFSGQTQKQNQSIFI
jgi:hypothetical protein